MKPSTRVNPMNAGDRAVAYVIGVVLLVAITVALVVGFYAWVAAFQPTGDPPADAAVSVSGLDRDDDGRMEWIRILLVRAPGEGFSASSVNVTVTLEDAVHEGACKTPGWTEAMERCKVPFESPGRWRVGQALYAPCRSPSPHPVTVTVQGTVVSDQVVYCGAALSP